MTIISSKKTFIDITNSCIWTWLRGRIGLVWFVRWLVVVIRCLDLVVRMVVVGAVGLLIRLLGLIIVGISRPILLLIVVGIIRPVLLLVVIGVSG